jgi:signal transduction histidine kinase
LLVNAAQAIEEHGTITVRTGAANEHVWIEVEDTGRGIPPENLKHIFDPFFTTKEVGKGTGMGLHLAYKIIEAHRGSINVESTVGKGSTFHIELPFTGPAEVKGTQHESVA